MADDDWRDDWGPRTGRGSWPPLPKEFPEIPELDVGDVSNGWRTIAACRDEPKATFFAAGPKSHLRHLCEGCPVEEACLFFVLATEDRINRNGFFAGTTPAVRSAMGISSEQARERYVDVVGAHRWDARGDGS